MVADTVFLIIGKIGVAGPEQVLDAFVFGGVLIFIENSHGDRSSGGLAFEDAGKYLKLIFFIARGSDIALAGPAAGQFGLNLVVREIQPRLDTVEYGTDRGAMTFAECGDADDIAVGVGRAGTDCQFLDDVIDGHMGDLFRAAAGGVDNDISERGQQFVAVGDVFR